MRSWIAPKIRDDVVAFALRYGVLSGLSLARLIRLIGIGRDKFYQWRERVGQANEHNALTPRRFWLEPWERQAIVEFARDRPGDGYRRLAWMMVDTDVVAASPSSVYRALLAAGLIGRRNVKPSKKGTGFKQPSGPHHHWHTDISYLNICGTFYYFVGLLDGFSRYLVHWEIRERMREEDVAVVVQRAREKFPEARPRIISDNGKQFVSREFKELIRLAGMTHVRISPGYPQSNGKIERFHRTLKEDCIRPRTPLSLEDARRVVGRFVAHYNGERLHSAIGYVTPLDKLEGRAPAILEERQRKLAVARARREARLAQRGLAGQGLESASPARDPHKALDEKPWVGQYC
jgi:transposase InsO family protein